MRTSLPATFAFELLLVAGLADPAPVGQATFAEVKQKKDQLNHFAEPLFSLVSRKLKRSGYFIRP